MRREILLSSCRKGSNYELIKQIPFDPPNAMGIVDVDRKWSSDFNLLRASWDNPCPTITATGAKMGRGGIYHPEENRLFTIAELKRITGLPDDFRLTGTFDQQAERIGRMVPPLMTKALAEAVYQKLLAPM